jgi:hypothetical protein
MKNSPDIFNDYYKEGICLKVLSFVPAFGKGFGKE